MSFFGKVLSCTFFLIMGTVAFIGERIHPGNSMSMAMLPLQLLCGAVYTGVLLLLFAIINDDTRMF